MPSPKDCHYCYTADSIAMVDDGDWPKGEPVPQFGGNDKVLQFKSKPTEQKFRKNCLQMLGPDQQWCCIYCHRQGDAAKGPDRRTWHIDHLYPLALGGDWVNDNLVLACATCNLHKSRKLLMEFLNKSILKRNAG